MRQRRKTTFLPIATMTEQYWRYLMTVTHWIFGLMVIVNGLATGYFWMFYILNPLAKTGKTFRVLDLALVSLLAVLALIMPVLATSGLIASSVSFGIGAAIYASLEKQLRNSYRGGEFLHFGSWAIVTATANALAAGIIPVMNMTFIIAAISTTSFFPLVGMLGIVVFLAAMLTYRLRR
jgi:hypothetical protein